MAEHRWFLCTCVHFKVPFITYNSLQLSSSIILASSSPYSNAALTNLLLALYLIFSYHLPNLLLPPTQSSPIILPNILPSLYPIFYPSTHSSLIPPFVAIHFKCFNRYINQTAPWTWKSRPPFWTPHILLSSTHYLSITPEVFHSKINFHLFCNDPLVHPFSPPSNFSQLRHSPQAAPMDNLFRLNKPDKLWMSWCLTTYSNIF